MIEGGGSRNYIEVKKIMYRQPQVWDELLRKLNAVLTEYVADQVKAGADVIQVFDSWVGCLSVEDYREYALPRTKELISSLRKLGVPIIYFGTDSTTLLPSMNETEADVIGLDWRVPFNEGWKLLDNRPAVQGNLDPVTLFGDWELVKERAKHILDQAEGRPGHIFNLGHGILPQTPVENVKNLAKFVQEYSAQLRGAAAGTR
jgi:uroporphyrinogen decarboxylase